MYLFLYHIIKKNQDKTSLKFVIDIKKVSKRNHITKESINEKPVFCTDRDVYTSKGR